MRRSSRRSRVASTLLSTALAAVAIAGCDEGGLKGSQSEVKETSIKLDLPEVPTFETPGPHPDGSHSVREMRLKGRKLFETEIEVKGFITWIYSCEEELRTPEMTDKEVKQLVEENPDKCNRPHFFIGDTADTPSDRSLWVVENPREPRKDERKNFTRAQLKELTDSIIPFAVGDEVLIKGTWDQKSPSGFFNSDGLLVYKEMTNLSNPPQSK